MDHFIEQIDIKNFKSIRDLTLTGFKRINLFIGRPNVGKSNLIESLSLFSLQYIYDSTKKITDFIRLKNTREIFYEGSVNANISVQIKRQIEKQDFESCIMSFVRETGGLVLHNDSIGFREYDESSHRYSVYRLFISIDAKLKVTKIPARDRLKAPVSNIKSYVFDTNVQLKEYDVNFLYPPFGNNLLYILQIMPELRQLYTQWFRRYGLRLVLDTVSQSLKVQREHGDEVFQLPYSSVADTLQRIIFYKTAVASNQNSVLLFEEPEAHAYPPYISEFTQEIIGSKTNQTFVVTHSPLIVNDMLDSAIDELAIFIVDFKDGQTVARALTQEELYEVRKFGVDLFFNGEAYPV